MPVPRIWVWCICQSILVLAGQGLNPLDDMNVFMLLTSQTPETEEPSYTPWADVAVTVSDPHLEATGLPTVWSPMGEGEVSEGARPETEGEQENAWEQGGADVRGLAGRRRRGVWGKRIHAPAVESTAYRLVGLGRPLAGWKRSGTGAVTGALMTTLKELHGQKTRLMDQEKAGKKEEDDEEDDDDDEEEEDDEEEDDDDEDEEEEEEEEEEEGQEGEEGEGQEGEEEEEEEEEGTEAPTNQTEALPVQCQTENQQIICRGVGITLLPSISDPGVTTLDLAENNISRIAPQGFSGLPNLETLDLSMNQLDDEGLAPDLLSNLTHLKKLNLDGNRLTRISGLPPSLEELKINQNKLRTLTPHSFSGLGNLMSLELKKNGLYEETVSPIAFRPLKKVLELRLSNNQFRFLPQGLPPSLQVLVLSNNLIEVLAEEGLKGFVHLKVLNLSQNLLHEANIDDRVWSHLVALEVLDLSYNSLALVPTHLPRSLRQLTLQHNDVSRIPGHVFRHLRPGLESLCLSYNALGDTSFERSSLVGTYRSLAELLLDNNHLEAVPRSVRQFKNLQVLRLNNNRIRLVRKWEVCHPRNSGTKLASVHLENNFLDVGKILPVAFSCVIHPQGVVLRPQQGHTLAL